MVKQFLENNIGEYLEDRQRFLKQNTKALTLKEKMNKLDLHQNRKFMFIKRQQ